MQHLQGDRVVKLGIPSALNAFLIAVGRVALASLFVLGGVNKLLNFSTTAQRMSVAGLVPAQLLLPLTIFLELGAGMLLARGGRWAWPAGLALALFTITTNVVFHRFWELSGPLRGLELSLFFKNISIAGALLYCAAAEKAKL